MRTWIIRSRAVDGGGDPHAGTVVRNSGRQCSRAIEHGGDSAGERPLAVGRRRDRIRPERQASVRPSRSRRVALRQARDAGASSASGRPGSRGRTRRGRGDHDGKVPLRPSDQVTVGRPRNSRSRCRPVLGVASGSRPSQQRPPPATWCHPSGRPSRESPRAMRPYAARASFVSSRGHPRGPPQLRLILIWSH